MKESRFSSFRLSLGDKINENENNEIDNKNTLLEGEDQQVGASSNGEGIHRKIADLRRLVLNKGKLQERFNESINRDSQPPPRQQVSYVQSRSIQRQHTIKEILSSNSPIDLLDKQHNDLMLEVLKKAIRNKEEISLIQLFLMHSSAMQLDPNGTLSLSDLSAQLYPFVSYSFASKDSTIYSAGQFAQHFYTVIKGSVGQINEVDFKAMTQAAQNKQKTISGSQSPSSKSGSANKKSTKFMWDKQETEQLLSSSSETNEFQYERIFKEGQSFGDVEILTNQTRSTTAVSLEDTHLIMISKEGFELVLVKFRKQQLEENINFFRQFSFFQEIPISRLLTLVNTGKQVDFTHKQIIYSEGEEIENIYFITRGEVSLSLIRDDRRINLQILGANAYFGTDESVEDSSLRLHRAQSNSNPLQTIVFPLSKLIKFLTYHKQLDSFMADASAKAGFRKGIAEKIFETQNQFLNDSEQSFKKQAEYNKEIRKHLEASLKLAPELNKIQREKEVSDLTKFEKVGRIVNAREEIFELLDRQRQDTQNKNFLTNVSNLKSKPITNSSFKQRFISQYDDASSSNAQTPQGQNSKNKNSQHLIFDSHRDLIFNQQYYLNQDSRRILHHNYNNSSIASSVTPANVLNQHQLSDGSRKQSESSSFQVSSPLKKYRRILNKTTNSFTLKEMDPPAETKSFNNPIKEFCLKNDININSLGQKLSTKNFSKKLEERLMTKKSQKQFQNSQEVDTKTDFPSFDSKNEETTQNNSQQSLRYPSRSQFLGINSEDSKKQADQPNPLFLNKTINTNIHTYSAKNIPSTSKHQIAHFHLKRDASIDVLQDNSQQPLLITSIRNFEKVDNNSILSYSNLGETPPNHHKRFANSTSFVQMPSAASISAKSVVGKSFNAGSPISNASGYGESASQRQIAIQQDRKGTNFSNAIVEKSTNKTHQKANSNILQQCFPSSFSIQAKQETDSSERIEKTAEQLPQIGCNSYDLIHNQILHFPFSLQKKFKLKKIEKLQKQRAILSSSSDNCLKQQGFNRLPKESS